MSVVTQVQSLVSLESDSMPLKSPEMAQKVVEAQSNDQVHLLICKAVFAFQCARGPAYHCHLEQPVGSEMLNQEVMQFVVSNTLRARCDFCKAGMLKRPQAQMPMQKGTQVLTTSIIMQRYLDSQRCPRDHEHAPVAGNYKRSDGTWGPISLRWAFPRTCGHRVSRTILASKQVQEISIVSSECLCSKCHDRLDTLDVKGLQRYPRDLSDLRWRCETNIYWRKPWKLLPVLARWDWKLEIFLTLFRPCSQNEKFEWLNSARELTDFANHPSECLHPKSNSTATMGKLGTDEPSSDACQITAYQNHDNHVWSWKHPK